MTDIKNESVDDIIQQIVLDNKFEGESEVDYLDTIIRQLKMVKYLYENQ